MIALLEENGFQLSANEEKLYNFIISISIEEKKFEEIGMVKEKYRTNPLTQQFSIFISRSISFESLSKISSTDPSPFTISTLCAFW